MTTSTTDAEAIARIIEDEIDRAANHYFTGGFTERASQIKNVASDTATAILSYLALRREAQEPVGYIRRNTLDRLCEGNSGPIVAVAGFDATIPLFTAPPAPAGEVERLVKPIIDRLEWNGRLQQWVVGPDLPAGTIKAVRAALNGGRRDE